MATSSNESSVNEAACTTPSNLSTVDPGMCARLPSTVTRVPQDSAPMPITKTDDRSKRRVLQAMRSDQPAVPRSRNQRGMNRTEPNSDA